MSSYWEKRKAQRMYQAMEDAEKAASEISKAYSSASRYLNGQIEGIFDRYRRKYQLSEKEARRLLNEVMDGTSFDEMIKALRKSVSSKEKKELLKELEAPAYRYRINRFQNLQNQIDDMMVNIYQQEKNISTSHYIDTMYDGYYKSVYDIQHNTGLGFSFSDIDPKQVNRILNSKWSGENYSTRIWGNTQEVAKKLKEEMLVGVMTGKTESEMAKEFAYRFQVGAFEARRLVRTESNFAYTQAEMLSYEECECDTYVFLATLDLITSQICRSLDMKRFKLKDQQPGKNCPPMHPFCRSTTIAGLDDQAFAKLQRRARDSETGKTYTVPGNMTYSEWLKQQQDKHGKDTVEKTKKKTVNFSSDKEQYYRYKDVLGDEFIPDSLDKFQQMKYNDAEKWNDIKGKYRIVNQYQNHTDFKMPASKILELDEKAFSTKRNDFSSVFKKSGNFGIMEFDKEIYFSHSKANSNEDKAFANFKGDRSKLVLKPDVQTFKTKIIGTHDRNTDSEYKLFECAARMAKDGKKHELFMLSELPSCDSCLGVLEQFTKQYSNVKVSMVSTKESRVQKKYAGEGKKKERFRNRWKK